uniref:hypothetical protein n=1 Tax=Armatimonas sp. TaxID=1872638 RepID=UPI00375188EC
NGSYSKAMGRSEDLRRAGIYDRIKGSKLSDEEKSKLMNEVNRQYGVEPGGDDMATKRTVKDIQQMVDQGISGSKTPSGASAATSQDANTKATENLTQTLQYLNKNIGETLRTQQSAAPGSLRGGNLYDAYSMGALRYGTLG